MPIEADEFNSKSTVFYRKYDVVKPICLYYIITFRKLWTDQNLLLYFRLSSNSSPVYARNSYTKQFVIHIAFCLNTLPQLSILAEQKGYFELLEGIQRFCIQLSFGDYFLNEKKRKLVSEGLIRVTEFQWNNWGNYVA